MNDITLAQKYINKARKSRERGISFELTFLEFKRLCNNKVCSYTGITMTTPQSADVQPADRTLERIDCSKGYSKDNCITVCHFANQLKGSLESKSFNINFSHIKKMINRLDTKYKKKANMPESRFVKTKLGELKKKD